MAANWSELPNHLLSIIATKLGIHKENAFFSTVCSSWNSIGSETLHKLCHERCPKLISSTPTTRISIQPFNGNDTNGYITYDHNLSNKNLTLDHIHNSYVCGSSLGWLVLIHDNYDMELFDPVSNERFDLPSSKTLPKAKLGFNEFCKYYVNRAIINVDPRKGRGIGSESSETVVVVIYSGAVPRLAFCRVGDKEWCPIEDMNEGGYENLVYYKERFYAVRDPACCDVVDIDRQAVVSYVGNAEAEGEDCVWPKYLVECDGRLFLVVRVFEFDSYNDSGREDGSESVKISEDYNDDSGENEDEEEDDNGDNAKDYNDDYGVDEEEDGDYDYAYDIDNADESGNSSDGHCTHGDGDLIDGRSSVWVDRLRRYRTVDFRVYRLEEESDEKRNWRSVESIGDNAFFLGYNSPFSLSATDKLGYKTCKPNSIYFTDDNVPFEYKLDPIRHDIGVFSLDNRTVESVFPAETEVMRPPPFWLSPN